LLGENDLLFESDITLEDAKEIKSEIIILFSKMNEYFNYSGKNIRKDKEGRITLSTKDKLIPCDKLSRGEKTVIYLFLSIFLERNSELFIIDEPEIGLHIDWQFKLIKDLMSIVPGKQFIVATHSPSIIEDDWFDSCVELTPENS
ncbi:AAA family ATPase, partial [Vibrio sp. 624788]